MNLYHWVFTRRPGNPPFVVWVSLKYDIYLYCLRSISMQYKCSNISSNEQNLLCSGMLHKLDAKVLPSALKLCLNGNNNSIQCISGYQTQLACNLMFTPKQVLLLPTHIRCTDSNATFRTVSPQSSRYNQTWCINQGCFKSSLYYSLESTWKIPREIFSSHWSCIVAIRKLFVNTSFHPIQMNSSKFL